jgi:hypothetical protein
MVLVAQAADGSGQRLEAYFNYHDVYEPAEGRERRAEGQRRSVSPGVVRRVILAALGRGWKPAARGLRPFRMQDADQVVPVGDEGAQPNRCSRPRPRSSHPA